jgi:hypothetical protein
MPNKRGFYIPNDNFRRLTRVHFLRITIAAYVNFCVLNKLKKLSYAMFACAGQSSSDTQQKQPFGKGLCLYQPFKLVLRLTGNLKNNSVHNVSVTFVVNTRILNDFGDNKNLQGVLPLSLH